MNEILKLIQQAMIAQKRGFSNAGQNISNLLGNKQTPYPVANLEDGGLLYSDGTTRNSPEQDAQIREHTATPQEAAMLNILKQNMLAQTSYTPEAVARIQQMTFHPYGQLNASSESNQSGGYVGPSQPNRVNINRNTFMRQNLGSYPIETARHEVAHLMDDNMYARSNPNGYGNGLNFFGELQKQSPQIFNYVNRNYRGIGDFDPRGQDIEAFATAGQRGEQVLKSPVGKRYSGIYSTAEKRINMSPVFPDADYLRTVNHYGTPVDE